MVDYGYGEAFPDSERYDYNVAVRDLEEEESAPAARYGYGDATPDSERHQNRSAMRGGGRRRQFRRAESQRTMGRRSSLKHAGAPRRSSIGVTGEIMINLPGQRNPVLRRRSISFDDFDEVNEIQPVQELTDKPDQLWFQDEEYNAIRQKARLITRIASSDDADEVINQHKLCTRGLESHIDHDYVEEEQALAWKSVFLEQHLQQTEGDFDDEALAKMYEMATIASRARALRRAQGDHDIAEKHTRKVRSILRRHSLVA